MLRLRQAPLFLFLLLWLASFTSYALTKDFFPKAFENRNWAMAPAWSSFSASPREFFKKTGDYALDHFGLRSTFIRLHNVLKYVVFRTSPTPMVMLGKDRWLFFAGQESVPFYRNANPFPKGEVERLSVQFEKTQAWLTKRHIRFVVFIPPDPPTVYGEKIYPWAKPEPGPTRRDVLIATLNRFMRIPVLDLAPALKEAKKEYPTYSPTDSHWSEWGAYVAARALMQQLHGIDPAFATLKNSDYRIEMRPIEILDLARSMGLPDYFSDITAPVVIAQPSARHYEKMQMKKTWVKDAHDYSTLCRHCPNRKVMVVRDSYSEAVADLFSSSFREVTYMWDNMLPFKQIEEEHPDLVIFEFVERKLRGLPFYAIPE
jgi:hypothetical protein